MARAAQEQRALFERVDLDRFGADHRVPSLNDRDAVFLAQDQIVEAIETFPSE